MNSLVPIERFSPVPIESEILALNEFSSEYGLTLSAEEAKELSVTRTTALKDNDRIEIGSGIVPEIIKKFCTSRYVNKENYTYILNQVTYLFYYIKTETDDGISDTDLINELFNRFELWCLGSIDSLMTREAEKIIRMVNSGDKYNEWYKERDELEDGGDEADREAPPVVSLDSYGVQFFTTEDTIADHDFYEPEVGEVHDHSHHHHEHNDELDPYDDLLDEADVGNKPVMKEKKKEDADDEE